MMFRKGCCSQRPPPPSPLPPPSDRSLNRPLGIGVSRESTRDLVVCAYLLQAVFSNLLHAVDAKVFVTQLTQRVVPTQYGRLRGILVSAPGGTLPQVEAFLGLEYASLLGGELRFMPPTSPVGKWEGIRNAVKFKPVCPQRLPDLDEVQKHSPTSVVDHFRRLIPFLERQQEDCLNLNVYVPLRDKNDTTTLFPVLVFIHGESYETGSGNAYDGSILSAFGQIVVVTLNYRLGMLGFLTTEDTHAPGNYGLLDQVAALHWIADNIRTFGGDPKQVTLMGHRYGASMVNLLMVSPVTRGKDLFHRVIIQSGSALGTWSLTSDPLLYTRRLVDHFNCSNHWGNAVQTIQCLKQVPVDDLINADIRPPRYLTAFGPTVDGRSVLPTPIRELATGSCHQAFGSTPLLIGVGQQEGVDYFPQSELDEGLTELRATRVLRTYVQNVYRYHQQKIHDILTHNYRDWDRVVDSAASRDELIDLIGDGQHVAPTVELAKEHAACAQTPPLAPTYVCNLGGIVPSSGGPRRGVSELAYAFGAPLADGIDPFASTYSEQDKVLSETILSYWTSFIRNGNPNDRDWTGPTRNLRATPVWPPFDLIKQEYLLIDNAPRVHHHYKSHKMALWLELIPRIHKPDIFNPLLHLLDDYQNRSSFEEEGTRDIDLSELLAARSTTQSTPTGGTTHLTDLSSSGTFSRNSSSSSSSSSSSPTGNLATRRESNHRRQTSQRDIVSTASLPDYDHMTLVAAEAVETGGVGGGGSASEGVTGSSTTLGVTIAVGCALLALNSLVFAATFCQWHRLGRTLRARQEEMGKDHDPGGYAVDVRLAHYDVDPVVLNDRCLTIVGSGCYEPTTIPRLPPAAGCLEGTTGKKQSTPQGSPTLSSALLGNSVRSPPARLQRQESMMLNRRNSPNDISDTQRTTLNQKYSTTVV